MVRVTPGARNDSVVGWRDGVLRVRVRARPERGKANEAVCTLLARALRVPPRSVSVVRGAGAREKVVRIEGVDQGVMRRRIGGMA
jgi:uncharacterized protein (TIGR00251 family)